MAALVAGAERSTGRRRWPLWNASALFVFWGVTPAALGFLKWSAAG